VRVMLIMEYSSRSLTPTPSTGSLTLVPRMLTPSPSAELLRVAQAASGRKGFGPQMTTVQNVQYVPLTVPRTMGPSLSVSSLMSVESDSSAPPPVAPPRSAQLNTGEVLQPYANARLNATGGSLKMPASQLGMHEVSRGQNVQSGRSVTEGPPNRGYGGVGGSMAMVHPQSVMQTRDPPSPVVQDRGIHDQRPEASDGNSTWVIEEVIDFGLPVDEGLVRVCDDAGYPLGCKSLSMGGSPRGNVHLFNGCVHNVCYDEQQVMEMHGQRQDGRDLC